MLAALLVYALHHPADSVAVELGGAVYFCAAALLFAWLAWWGRPALDVGRSSRAARRFDLSLWGLAGWMALAVWAHAGEANLRTAVNELWVWVAAAAVVTGVRRGLVPTLPREAILFLMIALSCGLAVHGAHQVTISLPVDRARYEADPDAVLAAAGIDPQEAPPGSAPRMNFANRLFDGGPTGTFALANSLAAPLLIGWVLVGGILLQQGRRHAASSGAAGQPRAAHDWLFLVLAGLGLVLLGGMLLATHSRSAVGSALLAAIGLAGHEVTVRRRPWAGGKETSRAGRHSGWVLAVLGSLLVGAVGLFWLASRKELVERALPSLWFRFQYWRSTWELALDSPWFGCGPGNFQAAYEAYRELSASEQVAEPHNWLMETLAAGGFPAVLWLLVAIGCLVQAVAGRSVDPLAEASAHPLAEETPRGEGPRREAASGSGAVWWGAGIGWLLIWLIGIGVGYLPDFDAQMLAVPVSVVFLVGMWRWRPAGLCWQPPVITALLAVLLHLSVSGGWTVPGVALPVWLLAGWLLPVPAGASTGEARVPSGPPHRLGLARLAVLVAGGLLLLALQRTAIGPRQTIQSAFRSTSLALARGDVQGAGEALAQAAAGDPWNPNPLVELAGIRQGELLQLPGSPGTLSTRGAATLAARFEELDRIEAAALQRAPRDPALWRHFGRQRLHLFQRWGRPVDLERATKRFRRAFELAPAQEMVAAQLAVIIRQQGTSEEADEWAGRARQLSAAGGHLERSLERVVVLPPVVVGEAVREAPRQAIAAAALAN